MTPGQCCHLLWTMHSTCWVQVCTGRCRSQWMQRAFVPGLRTLGSTLECICNYEKRKVMYLLPFGCLCWALSLAPVAPAPVGARQLPFTSLSGLGDCALRARSFANSASHTSGALHEFGPWWWQHPLNHRHHPKHRTSPPSAVANSTSSGPLRSEYLVTARTVNCWIP